MISDVQLSARVMQFINRLIFLEKVSVFEHGGVKLYPSELHLMQVVAEGGSIKAASMAGKLGITKGAVSQTLSRLERKGMITKTKNPSHKNELTVRFTASGADAIHGFAKTRTAQGEAYLRYFSGLSDAEKEVLQGFLVRMEQFLSGLG
jgi:DNA-binding MarR family transcriptional regulator